MKTLRIVEITTGKVEKEFDVTNKSERQIERMEAGILINLDVDRYFTTVMDNQKGGINEMS